MTTTDAMVVIVAIVVFAVAGLLVYFSLLLRNEGLLPYITRETFRAVHQSIRLSATKDTASQVDVATDLVKIRARRSSRVRREMNSKNQEGQLSLVGDENQDQD